MTRWTQGEALAACASYAFCSISLTLANKAIFSNRNLNYPWSVLLVQSLIVALLLSVYFTSGLAGPQLATNPIRKRLLKQLSIPTCFFIFFIFSNARALRTVSLPVLTVVKSLAPLAVQIAERVVFRDPVSGGTYISMFLIVLGNFVAASGDMAFHGSGYAWAMFNILANVAYVVSLRYCLDDTYTPALKTLHSNILAILFITPVAVIWELKEFHIEFALTDMRFRILFLFSCLLAAGIGASVFWVLKASTGSTLSFVGATNKVVVVILGALLFDSKVSIRGWAGVALGLTAGGCFAISKNMANRKMKFKDETELPTRIVNIDAELESNDNMIDEKSEKRG